MITLGTLKTGLAPLYGASRFTSRRWVPLTYVAAYVHGAAQQAELPKLVVRPSVLHTCRHSLT
jgi:hypothetical protein